MLIKWLVYTLGFSSAIILADAFFMGVQGKEDEEKIKKYGKLLDAADAALKR